MKYICFSADSARYIVGVRVKGPPQFSYENAARGLRPNNSLREYKTTGTRVKATERNRTADLIITSELLYHLSYGGAREIKKAYSI